MRGARQRIGLVLAIVAVVGVAAVLVLRAGRDPSLPSLSDEVEERIAAEGVSPELVYLVELPGYELAEQSAGVVGNDGFGATYVSADGGGSQAMLRVDRGRVSDDLCASAATCQSDDTGLYRIEADRHEYLVERDGDVLLRLTAPIAGVDRSDLGAAAAGARRIDLDPPTSDSGPVPSSTPSPTTVERGDLPSSGDGAPNNTVGPGD